MYIDDVMIFGLVAIALTCVVLIGAGRHAVRHFKEDSAAAAMAEKNSH